MCASKGWCCKTGRKASRTTIFFSNCQWGAIACKSALLRNAWVPLDSGHSLAVCLCQGREREKRLAS
jgi:hypothetical protein